VVIGISDYIGVEAGGYSKLSSARSDADKMVAFLRDTAGFDTIYLLTDDKATKPRRVILHDPALGLRKQPLPAPAGGGGILHVGLHPVLQHRPQQATLRLPADALGDLGRRSRQE